MDQLEKFFEAVKNEFMAKLATSDGEGVTMRTVSPVYYNDAILIFTDASSKKYAQLKANPHCCLTTGFFFAEATPEFLGSTMLPENEALRKAYDAKFPGAFAEGMENGGRNADFILLHPTRLTGWAFIDDKPTPEGIPQIPFEVNI